MFKRRNYFIVALLIISTIHIQCSFIGVQKHVKPDQGIIHLNVYIVHDHNILDFKTKGELFEDFVYYIKGAKILRLANKVPPLDTILNGQRLIIDKSNPTYLIDTNKKLVYTFGSQNGHDVIHLDSLKNAGADFVYTAMFTQPRPGVKILSQDEKSKQYSISDDYYYGSGVVNNTDTFYFKYTTKKLPVPSPLNFFVAGFEHDIVTISFPLKPRPGKLTSSRLLFNIDKDEAKSLPDSNFMIPRNESLTPRTF
jgi:hypothetical protein